jgi:predicted ATP-grasp superfamily ATP-dependent carboligase
MRWENFSNSILDQVGNNPSTILITLGAMLAEVPHTRPVPVNGATINKELQDLTGYTMSNYEGPTGILSVLAAQAERRGVAAASIWAALPHYVGAPPCPKATLALIRGLEDILNISIPVLELVEDARAWQTGVEELAIEDEEVAEYIRSLEESQDTAELPEASGEAIAREFERYLRRREN